MKKKSPKRGAEGGNPLLAAIRNKGGASSLKKKPSDQKPSLGNKDSLNDGAKNTGGPNTPQSFNEPGNSTLGSGMKRPELVDSPSITAMAASETLESLTLTTEKYKQSLRDAEHERNNAKEMLIKVKDEIQAIHTAMELEAKTLQTEKEKLEELRKRVLEKQQKQKELSIEDIELNHLEQEDTFAPAIISKPVKVNNLENSKTVVVRSSTPNSPRSRRSSKQSNDGDFTQEDYALELRKDIDDLLRSGRRHYQRHEFEKGKEMFEDARELAVQINDKLLEGKALSNLASLQEAMGNSHAAIDNNLTCMKIFHDLGKMSKATQMLYNLAYSYKSLGRYEDAIDYLNQCLEMAKDGSKIKEMALAQLNVVRESLINKFEDEDDVGDVQDSSDDDTGTDGSGLERADFEL